MITRSLRSLAAVVLITVPVVAMAGSPEFPQDAKLNELQRLRRNADEESFRAILDPSRWQRLDAQQKAAAEEEQLKQLSSREESARLQAINALAALGSKKAVPEPLKIAVDRKGKGNRDRWMATRALGIIGDRSAVPELVHLTYHYHQNTQAWAQISLVRLTGENFGRDVAAWRQWWQQQGGTPPISEQMVAWTNKAEEADPKKLDEHDRQFVEKAGQPRPRQPSPVGQPPPMSDTAKTSDTGPKTGSLTEQAIRGLREAIDNWYSYRDVHRVNWDTQFKQHEAALRRAARPEDFAAEAAAPSGAAKDAHISVEANGGRRIYSYNTGARGNYNDNSLKRVVPNFQDRNSLVATGRFPDGIGYLLIKRWDPKHKGDVEAAYQALAQWEKAPAVIVDVRPNPGGDDLLASQVAGCFVDEPVVFAKHVWRDPHAPGGFTPVEERTLLPTPNRPKYRGRIAVLMGPKCLSSNESFLLMMKQVPHCTLIGERSYGGSGNPKPHKLANGVTVYLPLWKALRLDGTCFEGEGISPDVRIHALPAAFEKADPVIEAALRVLRGKKLTNACFPVVVTLCEAFKWPAFYGASEEYGKLVSSSEMLP